MSTLTIARHGWRYPAHSMAAVVAASAVADAVWVELRRSGDGKLILWDTPEMGGREVATTRWVVLADTDLGGGHRPALFDEALAISRDIPFLVYVPNDPGAPGYEPDHRVVLEAAARARDPDLLIASNPESLARVRGRFDRIQSGLYLHDPAWAPDADTLVVDFRSRRVTVEAGVRVIVDRVESPDVARELARLGAWGIITTRPETVRAEE